MFIPYHVGIYISLYIRIESSYQQTRPSISLWIYYIAMENHHFSIGKTSGPPSNYMGIGFHSIPVIAGWYTPWFLNIAMKNGPFIDDWQWFIYWTLVISHSYIKWPKGILIVSANNHSVAFKSPSFFFKASKSSSSFSWHAPLQESGCILQV